MNEQLLKQLDKFNSLTKYPSIPTLHKLSKGKITNEINFSNDSEISSFIATEKIDGTNARIIFDFRYEDYFIGTRNDIIYAKGDRIINDSLGIVKTLIPIADKILLMYLNSELPLLHNDFVVMYFEVFGGKVTKNSKNYTSNQAYDFRLLDVAHLPKHNLSLSLEEIVSLRENNKLGYWQSFNYLQELADKVKVKTVPLIQTIDIAKTISPNEVCDDILLKLLPKTMVKLDDKALGRPEGIVLRKVSEEHSLYKIRYQDYLRRS